MTDLTAEVLDELERLEKAATPGPWSWGVLDHSMACVMAPDDDEVLSLGPCESCAERAKDKGWKWGRCSTPKEADATIITEARNHLPALIAAARRGLAPVEGEVGKTAEAPVEPQMPDTYCDRVWLNVPRMASTGSVVAYDGPSPWNTASQDRSVFFEVADCHVKARLHLSDQESRQDFRQKLTVLRDAANRFINHLGTTQNVVTQTAALKERAEKAEAALLRANAAIRGVHPRNWDWHHNHAEAINAAQQEDK